MDDDGYLYITEWKKDLIIRGGKHLSQDRKYPDA